MSCHSTHSRSHSHSHSHSHSRAPADEEEVGELEAGQLRLSPVAPIGLGRHTQADQEEERIDTSDDDASRISNAAADAETEYDSVSCVRVQPVVGPSPPPLSRVESASLPQLLQVATTSHQVDTSTTSLWSLPLPSRAQPQAHVHAATCDEADESPAHHTHTRSAIRDHLLRLSLPVSHVDAVLLARDAQLPSAAALPLDHWIELVMDEMYREQHTRATSQSSRHDHDVIVDVTAAPSLVPPVPTPAPAPAPGVAPICAICWDRIDEGDTEELRAINTCHHWFCAACWNGYLSAQVMSNHVTSIRCPSVTPAACSRVIESGEVVRRLRSSDLRARYLHLAELARIARDPSCRWCPTAGCETLLVGGSVAHPRITCATCTRSACFRCGLSWHGGRSCDDAADDSIADFLAHTPEADIKVCPACMEGLQRTDGCNFVRCPRCQHELCWLCLGPYTDHHYAWWNLAGCPLMHTQACACAGDDRCCCFVGGAWVGRSKRALTRGVLLFVYAVMAVAALPILVIAAPYLIYRYHRDRHARARRRQLKARTAQMTAAQSERARRTNGKQPISGSLD